MCLRMECCSRWVLIWSTKPSQWLYLVTGLSWKPERWYPRLHKAAPPSLIGLAKVCRQAVNAPKSWHLGSVRIYGNPAWDEVLSQNINKGRAQNCWSPSVSLSSFVIFVSPIHYTIDLFKYAGLAQCNVGRAEQMIDYVHNLWGILSK